MTTELTPSQISAATFRIVRKGYDPDEVHTFLARAADALEIAQQQAASMEARARALLTSEEPTVFCGDYNVIPQDTDAAKPEAWQTDALALPASRAAYRRLLALGLTDALRARNPAPDQYTFWDYQAGAWERNNGIRIDHLLLSPQAADLLKDCQIDKQTRAGDKPSDHVPIWIDLDA